MKWLFSASLLLPLSLFALSPYPDRPRDYRPPPEIPSSSFVYTVDISKLQVKCARPLPTWVVEQVEDDLELFKENKITQRALEATYQKVASYPSIAMHFARYRVIDQKIYRYGPDQYGMDAFFRTLAWTTDNPRVPDLPNVDFIYNQSDGIPLDDDPENYWITADREDQAPILTYAKLSGNPYLICVPDRFTIAEWYKLSKGILAANAAFPWALKKRMAFWRGQPTDYYHHLTQVPYEEMAAHYSQRPRFRICDLSKRFPDYVDAGFNTVGAMPATLMQFIQPYMRPGCYPGQHLEFAYLPVLDGAMCTYPGYLWRLLSNSVAFKQESSGYQWFYKALKP